MKNRILLLVCTFLFSFGAFAQNANISVSADVNNLCVPMTVNFTANTPSGAYHYYWSYYNYSQNLWIQEYSNSNTYTATFYSPGTNTYVYVDVYDANWNYLGNNYVNIVTKGSQPYISASQQSVCPNTEVGFWTYGDFSNYTWDFGDGTILTNSQSYANHQYASTGLYTVEVKYANDCGGYDSTSLEVNVENNLHSPVQINPSSYSVCPGANVSFGSGFNANSYFWDFGDGATASGNSYTNHIFANAGNYQVKLVTVNGCGIADSTTVDISVNSNSSFPTNIQINGKEKLCPGERFNMSTEYGYKQYLFDFGDGFTYLSNYSGSNEHTYANPGIYTLSVKITNFCGQDTTIYRTLEVSNNITPGSQGFGAQVTQQTCPGSPINLNAWGDIKKFIWDMGEGVADTTYSSYYNYTYQTAGVKGIMVTLTNYCGIDTTLLLTTDINSNTPLNNANAYVYPEQACPGERISFSANAEGTNQYFIVFSTNLNDTIYSSYTNASNFTTPGTYTAYYGIKNLCGNDTVIEKSFTVTNSKHVNNNVGLYMPATICVNAPLEICPPWGYNNYSWDFGNGNSDFSVNNKCLDQQYATAGTYTVSVSFENQCGLDTTVFRQITIVNSKPFDEINVNGNPSVCPGDEWNGGVSLSQADYNNSTYSWNFGDGNTLNTTRSYINHVFDSIGTYTATVSINNGCGADSTISMVVAVGLNDEIDPNEVWAYTNSYISCPNTLINFRASDGYQKYFWDFGNGDTLTTSSSQINKTFTNVGDYRLKVRVFNGCNKSILKTVDFKISNSAQISGLYIAPIQGDVCPGDNVFFRGDNDGSGATASSGLTYSWQYGDSQVGYTYTNTSYHAYSDTGVYTVNVTAYNTCGDSLSTSIQVDVRNGGQPEFVAMNDGSAIIIPNYEGGSVGCPGDAITMLYLGEFASNNFEFGDGTSSPSTGELNVAGYKYHTVTHIYDAPGDYWVYLTVSNACGASITDSLKITIGNTTSQSVVEVFALPSKKPEGYTTCIPVEMLLTGAQTYEVDFGDGNSSITSSPTLTHSYATAGFYHISVKGTNGCGVVSLSSTDVIINNGGTLTTNAIASSPSCYNGNNGSITIDVQDGVAPYHYEWRNFSGATSNTLSGLSAGTYYVSVSDSVGCLKDLSVDVINAPEIAVSAVNVVRPDCQTANGSIQVSASNGNGAYTYYWSNNVAGDVITNVASGLYTVNVTDASGCVKSTSFSLVDNNGPSVAIDSMFSLLKVCKGGNDANIEIAVTGGTQPYSYTWTNGSASPNQSNLEEGVYGLTVRDNTGCMANVQVAIDAYPAIYTDINVTRSPDCKQANGEVQFVVSGGSGSFELSLDGNVLASNDATGLNAGKHTLSITDLSSFCTQDTSFYIDNAGTLDFSITKKNPKCYGSTDGLISIIPSGGTPSYYSIVTSPVYNSPKSTKVLFNNLGEATYRIQVEDKVGCIVNQLVTLSSPDSLAVSYDILSAYCGNTNGLINGMINGGTTPYSVALTGQSNQSGSGFSFNNLIGGNYTLTVTDSNFCQKSKAIFIETEAENFSTTINTTASVCNRTDGTSEVLVSGGYAPYYYSWSAGNGIGNTVSGLTPGIYTVTINDGRNCSTTETFEIDTVVIAPGICLVTVDTLSEKNLVVWEKPLNANLQSFNVYKEGGVQNQFDLIGNVPVNQFSEYLDVTSDTRSHKDRYKISGVDSCGNESELSNIHETIHLSISAGTGTDWNLLWNNYQGLPIGSYTIWRSTDSVNYSYLATRPAAVDPQFNTYTDVTAPNGLVFYKVSFDAPADCNSGLFKTGNPNQVMGTYRKVKSNVGSNRMANPNSVKNLANAKLEVYPNPNSGSFTIEFGYFDNPVMVEITNQLGQSVKKIDLSEVKGNQVNVNFANFDSGVYFVHFVSDNSNLTKRIIKY